VRALAERAGLPVARRRDSQDLCFLAGTRQSAFLQRHGGLGERPGPIVDRRGNVLGEHRGVHTITIGQRRGIGVSAAQPLYVVDTDARANTVVVGPREELLARALPVRDLVLHRDSRCVDAVRIRAHGRRLRCHFSERLGRGRHRSARIELLAGAERTASGQLACLYAGDLLVGHGTIDQ
jgi:tRNA-specific 2-thiouridylase